jgi:polyphenol oxidase
VGVLARGEVVGERRSAEWLFTDRLGGASTGAYAGLNLGGSVGDAPEAVAANRREVAGWVDAEHLALVRQVHGRDVAFLREVPEQPPSADAIVTDRVDLPIAVQVADCVPVLLADVAAGRVAAVHAGWRGVVADVVGAAMQTLDPSGEVSAWVGPAICPACYEVSAEVRDQVADIVPEAAALTRSGTPAVDVRAGVLAQLRRHGVAGTLVGGCTFEDPALYSYRRDVTTGRLGAVIVLRERA